MSLIVNISPKKSGTSTIYNLLKNNFPTDGQDEFFVPPFKEYYIFPRNTELFFNLDLTIEKERKNKLEYWTVVEKTFFSNLSLQSTKTKLFTLTNAFREKNYPQLIDLCLDRLGNIWNNIDYRNLYISDNNLFEDFLSTIPQKLYSQFLDKFNDIKRNTRYFVLYRNPIETTVSLARMQYRDTGRDPYSREDSIQDWLRENFVRTCIIHNIRHSILKHPNTEVYFFDFEYFIRNQKEFLDLFCEKFYLTHPKRIQEVDNDNSKASWLGKNPHWDKNIERKIRDYLLHQVSMSEELSMELSLYDKISKKRFAVLDNSTFAQVPYSNSKYLN